MVDRICWLVGIIFFVSTGVAQAGLQDYVDQLNIAVEKDSDGYRAHLETHFSLSDYDVTLVLASTQSPADAAIICWMGDTTHQPIGFVLDVYRSQKSKGWGAVAKTLGIKPGSPAFHALKQGNIPFNYNGTGADKSLKKNNKMKKGKDG
jgi:hypothetical protein